MKLSKDDDIGLILMKARLSSELYLLRKLADKYRDKDLGECADSLGMMLSRLRSVKPFEGMSDQ